MKLTGRSFAGLGFSVCLAAMTSACGSRSTPPDVPAAQPAPPPTEPASTPSAISEPPSAPPAVTAPRPEIGSVACELISEPAEPIATVGLSERIDPANAPYPSNESERLLFRQLYETLVQVDCGGRVGPGLAASWRLDASGRTWIVTLRENARFSDGTPVTAADVLSGWTRSGSANELRPQVSRLIESIVLADDRALAITPRRQPVDGPMVLAHADLAIAKPVPGSRWPLGTRSARIAPDREAPGNGVSMITLSRIPAGLSSFDASNDLPFVRFLVAPDRDRRDLLDEGVDLLLTRDRAALDYAGTLPQFLSVPLAWQRTHVFVAPGRSRTSRSLPAEARQALADDAVRGEARGAEEPFWWQMLPDCEIARPQPRDPAPTATGRIVYDARDNAARDLAERLVGLASASGPGASAILDALLPGRATRAYRATGLTGQALALARQRGADAGYVVSLDRRPLDPCRELQNVVDGARWLDPEAIVPLVDTRLRAIVRRGRSGVDAEWDGGLLITGVGAGR